jgi:crossover junction endodeoxyribonuclease RusA
MITIPYPPSVNHYYRNGKNGRKIVCKKGKDHQMMVLAICRNHGIQPTRKQLSVHFVVSRPDNRRRDLDNLLKCLCDSLTKGGMWNDDRQIIDLRIMWADETAEETLAFEVKDDK